MCIRDSNTDVSSGPIDPFVAIYGAVARKTIAGLDFGREEALTPREAIECFTQGGAYLAYRDRECGALVPGRFADLAIPVSYTHLDVYKRQHTESLFLEVIMHASYIFSTLFVFAGPIKGVPFLIYSCAFAATLWITVAFVMKRGGFEKVVLVK